MGLPGGEHIWSLPIPTGNVSMRERYHIGIGYPLTDGTGRNKVQPSGLSWRLSEDRRKRLDRKNKTFS